MIKEPSDYIELLKLKDELKEFGKLEICEEIKGGFHVKITKGYINDYALTFQVMKKINDFIGHKFNKVGRSRVAKNLFDYVLTE